MDTYDFILDYLFDYTLIQKWPEMKDLLSKAGSKKPRDWQLPVLACKAIGGDYEQVIQATASIACLQMSIILVDDMLDGDSHGVHNQMGAPATANLALAFHTAGLDVVTRSKAGRGIKFQALRNLNQMMLTTALGQYMDVQSPKDEEDYWRIVRAKSSPFFGSALYIGALMGGATASVALQIERFGYLYGEMIQIHADLNDTMAVPANSDWTLGRMPLPILYAHTVDHPEKARFLELRQAIPDPLALTEAQTMLVRIGAVSYCTDQLFRRYHAARKILSTMVLPEKAELESLLEGVVEPVKNLYAAAGLPPSPALLQPTGIVI